MYEFAISFLQLNFIVRFLIIHLVFIHLSFEPLADVVRYRISLFRLAFLLHL